MSVQRHGLAMPPDAAPATHESLSYHPQWKALAIRRNLALFLLSTWIPVSLALFEISRNGWHRPILSLVVIFLWLIAGLAAVWWAGEFRCPRCRRRYGALGHRKGAVNLTRGLFDKVCSNCKLRKFERPLLARGTGRPRHSRNMAPDTESGDSFGRDHL